VDDLEMEVKCKDALIAARHKRDAEEDAAVHARLAAAEEPLNSAPGGNLASKLGDNWVSVDTGIRLSGTAASQQSRSAASRASKLGKTSADAFDAECTPNTSQSARSIISTRQLSVRRRGDTRASQQAAPVPDGVPNPVAGLPLRPSVPPGHHLTFFTGHSRGGPAELTSRSISSSSSWARSGRATRRVLSSRASSVLGHPCRGCNSRSPTPLPSPLVPFKAVEPHFSAAFTRGCNKAGILWDQPGVNGQSAEMGMLMQPPPARRKLLKGPQIPRHTEVRVLPLNQFDPAYPSTHPSLSHVGYPPVGVM